MEFALTDELNVSYHYKNIFFNLVVRATVAVI